MSQQYPQQPQFQPQQQIIYQQVVRGPSNGMAVTALVLGICALFFGISVPIPFWGIVVIFLAFPLGVLAVILGHIGLNASRRVNLGRGPALAGLILGYVTIGICVLTTVFWIVTLAASAARSGS